VLIRTSINILSILSKSQNTFQAAVKDKIEMVVFISIIKGVRMKKEYERRRSILEKAQKLKEKGLILKGKSEIVGVSQRRIKRWEKYKREIGLRG
jgi:hypothetical protein